MEGSTMRSLELKDEDYRFIPHSLPNEETNREKETVKKWAIGPTDKSSDRTSGGHRDSVSKKAVVEIKQIIDCRAHAVRPVRRLVVVLSGQLS